MLLPDGHWHALSSQKAGNHPKAESVADVGQDHHGHGDEAEAGGQVVGDVARAGEVGEEAEGEEGHTDEAGGGHEQHLPEAEIKGV